jgi:hypothetical protein
VSQAGWGFYRAAARLSVFAYRLFSGKTLL